MTDIPKLIERLREPRAWMAWNDYGKVTISGDPIPSMDHDSDAPRLAADALEELQREKDAFYMEYRLKCDEETKALQDQLIAVQDALDYLKGLTPEQYKALRDDAERWRTCVDAAGVSVSIFNVDPPCWRYPEGKRLIDSIDAIRTGSDNAWSVPIDTGQ